MNNDSFRSERRGFTLIEVALVVALLGIVALLATPKMSQFAHRSQVDGILNQLASDVTYSRMLAVREGKRTRLRYENGSYAVIVDPSGVPRVDKTVQLRREYPNASLTPVGPWTIDFDSRGLPVGSTPPPGTLTATMGNATASLMITSIGRTYRVD